MAKKEHDEKKCAAMRRIKPNKKPGNKIYENTVMMYVMTISSQLFQLATVPYLTRVLGAVVYGKVGLALSYMIYIYVIMDLGFLLSATQKVAEHRDEREYLSRLFTSVTVIKLIIGAAISTLFLIFAGSITNLREDFTFYALYLAAYIVYAMLPDFMYRGFEDMKVITYISVFIKMIFTVLIFLFVRDKSQYQLIPLITLMGHLAAVLVMYMDVTKRYGVRLCRAPRHTIWRHAKDSAQFFVSRISSTAYHAANTIVLNFIYGSTPVIGHFTVADKVVSLARSCSSPVADSLFPYMVKNKNYQMIWRIFKLVMPVIVAAGVVCAVFAEEICVIFFGAEYRDAGLLLRLLLPCLLVIFPQYILAFPVMVPMGLAKHSNLSNVLGLMIQAALIGGLLIAGKLTVYTICVATSISEVSVFLARLTFVLKHRHRMRKAAKEV